MLTILRYSSNTASSPVNWCKVLQFLSVAYVACGGNVFCEIDDFDIQYVCTYVHAFK